MEAIETFEGAGFTVSVYHDQYRESPQKWHNLGKMVCWHRRYKLGDQTVKPSNFGSVDELEASFAARVCLPL